MLSQLALAGAQMMAMGYTSMIGGCRAAVTPPGPERNLRALEPKWLRVE